MSTETIEQLEKRLRNIETSLSYTQQEMQEQREQLDSYKNWFMAISRNQKVIAERIASWPYVMINNEDKET